MNAQAAEEQPRRKQRRWDSRSQNGEENRNQRSRSPKKPGTRQRRTSRRSSCLYSDEDLEARRSRPSRSREFRHREERRAERRWNREERKRRIDDEAGNRHYKRRRRKRRSNSPSGSNPSVKNNARTGVVSIEEERPIKTEHSSSFHDDTIGHYKCGKGAIIDDRYRVEREVGLGTFGRVLECTDLRKGGFRSSRSGQVVAIKVVRNQKRYYESALLEAKIIAEINRKGGRGLTHCVVMHDAFTFRGHYCMVFESLGPSLYDFLKRHNYQGFPIFCVEDFAMQLLEACEFLHRNRIIHTDLKLENILLMNDREVHRDGHQVPESSRIKLIDFGGACYDDEKKSSIINTRQYRSPGMSSFVCNDTMSNTFSEPSVCDRDGIRGNLWSWVEYAFRYVVYWMHLGRDLPRGAIISHACK